MIHLILCNYNTGSRLREVLDSFEPAFNNKQLYSVNLIDNKSSDNPKSILDKYNFNLLINSDKNLGKALASNHVFGRLESLDKIQEGDYIGYFDSDMVVNNSGKFFNDLPGLLRIMLNEARASSVVTWQTDYSRHLVKSDDHRFCEFGGFELMPDMGTGIIAGGNFFTLAKYWKAVGGYHEDYPAGVPIYGNEEFIFWKLISHTRLPIALVKNLSCSHPYPQDSKYEEWKLKAINSLNEKKGFYDS